MLSTYILRSRAPYVWLGRRHHPKRLTYIASSYFVMLSAKKNYGLSIAPSAAMVHSQTIDGMYIRDIEPGSGIDVNSYSIRRNATSTQKCSRHGHYQIMCQYPSP